MKYVCQACGFVYDEDLGDPDNGIPAGTKFEDLPEDYKCAWCGAGKDMFAAQQLQRYCFMKRFKKLLTCASVFALTACSGGLGKKVSNERALEIAANLSNNYVDLGTHGMFICSVTESKIINNIETMTYNYYQANVKPKPDTEKKKGYVCKVCGYVHEGDLPDDFICPLCKHGVADFEEIK